MSRFTKIIIILAIIAAIPLTVFIAQQQQQIKQRAAEPEATPNQVIKLPLKIPVLTLEFYPPSSTNPNLLDLLETGWVRYSPEQSAINYWKQETEFMILQSIHILNDGSKYHGYKDLNAVQFLNYSVWERIMFYQPIPKGFPLLDGAGKVHAYRPNYKKILEGINICTYVDDMGVKEIWMYGYHNDARVEPGIEPDESRMSSKYGDISNSSPKDEGLPQEYRLPRCKNSYTLYNLTYQPSMEGGNYLNVTDNVIHDHIHQIENAIAFAEGGNRWPPIAEDKPNSNIKGGIFWGNFSEYVQKSYSKHTHLSSCGNAHYPPNWNDYKNHWGEYIYSDATKKEFNCETWNPDPSKTTYINAGCERWGCTPDGFYLWWMQNIPGYNNGITYNGQQMKNWWEAIYDFNAFIEKGRSLYGESIFSNALIVAPPSPTQTPIIPTSAQIPSTVSTQNPKNPQAPTPTPQLMIIIK